jgi:hypothetical protein
MHIFIIKNGAKLTYKGLASRCTYYEKIYFLSIIKEESKIVTENADKSIIRNLLTKPWNLYVKTFSIDKKEPLPYRIKSQISCRLDGFK